MCRTAGRRCPCTTGQRQAHNERRRNNRRIKAAVVAAAAKAGVSPTVLDELRGAPPKVAKEWVQARGIDPDRFLATDPPSVPQHVGPDEVARVADAAAAARRPHQRDQAAPAVAADLKQRLGVAHPPKAEPPAAPPQSNDVQPHPRRVEVIEPWRTPELNAQLDTAIRSQGVHRDERSLLGGGVLHQEAVGEGTNETTRVELDNGVVGYHKAFSGLNDRLARGFGQDSAQQSLHEVAAWQLAREMGPPWSDAVPSVVVREVNGELGSFALERPGSPGGGQVRSKTPEQLRDRLKQVPEWQSAAFYDSLIGQQDRHPMNYLIAGDRLALIDHGYTFAMPGDYTNWSMLVHWRCSSGGDRLTHAETDVLRRLISSPDLLGMEALLQKDRASALRRRAERMLTSGRMLNVSDF